MKVVTNLYKSITKDEVGELISTNIDKVSKKPIHVLKVNGEERLIPDITLKRWWTPVEVKQEPVVVEKVTKKVKQRKEPVIVGIGEYLKNLVEENGCEFHVYSEGREGVVKFDDKPFMFFTLLKKGMVKICLKDELDFEGMKFPYAVEENNNYPKQYPYRFIIIQLDEKCKQTLQNIIKLYT